MHRCWAWCRRRVRPGRALLAGVTGLAGPRAGGAGSEDLWRGAARCAARRVGYARAVGGRLRRPAEHRVNSCGECHGQRNYAGEHHDWPEQFTAIRSRTTLVA